MKKYRITALALTAAVVALTACSDQEEPKPTPAPASSTPTPTAAPSTASPSPSPSPSPSAPASFPAADPSESAEIAAIRKGWEAYEKQYNRFAKDSSLNDLTDLVNTTTGQESISVVKSIGTLRDNGRVHRGDISFRKVKIAQPQENASGENISTITMCKDFSKHQIVEEATGKRVDAGEGREWVPTMQVSIIMQQNPDGNWVVSDGRGERKEC